MHFPGLFRRIIPYALPKYSDKLQVQHSHNHTKMFLICPCIPTFVRMNQLTLSTCTPKPYSYICQQKSSVLSSVARRLYKTHNDPAILHRLGHACRLCRAHGKFGHRYRSICIRIPFNYMPTFPLMLRKVSL